VKDKQRTSGRDKHGDTADQVWQTLVTLVMDSRGDWRRKVSEATGLPFSRLRALRRLVSAPMTMKELADVASMDAPAATVAVNYLEERGLVERYPHPENRRAKLVRLTAAGRRVVGIAHKVSDQVPAALGKLPPDELATLLGLLVKVSGNDEHR
jgi:DNA-binding MarR family transcriptional regulator